MWVPPSDITSYDDDQLLDLAGISDSDRRYVKRVTIEELTNFEKVRRKRAAKLTQEISHNVIIQVEAENEIQIKKVVQNIVRSRYEKVFEEFKFEFKIETGATQRWKVSTKGHGKNEMTSTQPHQNRMRDLVKLAIAVYTG